MTDAQVKSLILAFIKRHTLGVVSTIGPDGGPQSAVVEFGETENLELIFDTSISYRKYQNLKADPRVAFVIGWDEDITVQYQGIARMLAGDELAWCKQLYFTKNPKAQRWEADPDICYYKVTPHWIRYSNLVTDPWQVLEVKF